MKNLTIIKTWLSLFWGPEKALDKIENIGIRQGFKSLLLGFLIPAAIVTLFFLFFMIFLFFFSGIVSSFFEIPLQKITDNILALFLLPLLYVLFLIFFFFLIVILCTIFGGLVRIISKFTGGQGTFKKDLSIIYFLAGGLVAILGIFYILLIPAWLVMAFIPIIGTILGLIFYFLFLIVVTFVSGTYLGAFFELFSKIEKKSLIRLGGIAGVSWSISFMVCYVMMIAFFFLFSLIVSLALGVGVLGSSALSSVLSSTPFFLLTPFGF